MKQSTLDFKREKDKERDKALRDVARAYSKWQAAKTEYEDAVLRASALGLSNTQIARKLDVSETAVRMFLKRREGTAV